MKNDEKWDLRFIEITKVVSLWSKDPSRKVGAIIVGNKKQIISQGYNGFPRNIKDTDERLNNRILKYQYVIHAEMNALYNALYNGSSVDGATIYVYGLPVCNECAKAIIQSGIKRVVMAFSESSSTWNESFKVSKEMFDEVGIEYKFLDLKTCEI